MPLLRYNPGPGQFVWDSWGQQARNDWAPVPGRDGFWQISGESPNPNEGLYGGPFYGSAAEASAANPRPAGPTSSENAYNAALRAQGIDPSELPMATSGQEATARVQQEHGLPIADWLKPYLPQAAGGGHSAQPGAFAGTHLPDEGGNFDDSNTMPLDPRALPFGGNNVNYGANGSPDPFTNGVVARFLERTASQNQQANSQVVREMIKKVLLAGQGQKAPISPHLVRAAMQRRPQ